MQSPCFATVDVPSFFRAKSVSVLVVVPASADGSNGERQMPSTYAPFALIWYSCGKRSRGATEVVPLTPKKPK